MISTKFRSVLFKLQTQYHQLDGIFTESEAWTLFKYAAFFESFGWLLLITGIIFTKFQLTGHDWVLPVAGSIHGLFYIFYVLIILFGHRSLGWSVKRFLVAEILSNVPFGAFIFERYSSMKRDHLAIQSS